jgi:Tfp pilus assembly protein FimT
MFPISFRGSRVKPGMTQMLGFSLLELIVSVAVFLILGGMTAIPFASRFFNRNDLETKTNELVSSLRIAQINSVSGKESSKWGVHTDATKIIMFKGSSYIPPGTSFDQSFVVPPTLTITPVDVTFDVVTGSASATQTITIGDTLGQQYVVSVNQTGSVNVN